MPSSTSFHVGICTFSLFFPLGVYVCVCVKGNFVILLVSEGGFLQKTKKKKKNKRKVRLGSHRKTMKIGFVTLLTFADSLLG